MPRGNESTKVKKYYDTIKAFVLARVNHTYGGGVFPNMMSNFNIGTRVAYSGSGSLLVGRTSNLFYLKYIMSFSS